MNDKTYDFCKWLVLIFLPALAVLVKGLADVYHIIYADTIVATLNLSAVFLGSILQISSHNYHDSSKGGDGNGQSVTG